MSTEPSQKDAAALVARLAIRPLQPDDTEQVCALFVRVNRQLAPPSMREVFEAYIALALREEMQQLGALYAPEEGHGFWVAVLDDQLVGMVGLKRTAERTAEIRRMYVDPDWRRLGIGRTLLRHAEAEARRYGYATLLLDTAEIQTQAIRLYQSEGYALTAERTAHTANVRTVGHGINRLHFEKQL